MTDLQSSQDSPTSTDVVWPQPAIIRSVGGKVRIPNDTNVPIVVKKHSHFAQVSPVVSPESEAVINEVTTSSPPVLKTRSNNPPSHSSSIGVDPDNWMSSQDITDFTAIHREYDHVFDPKLVRYNGAVGPIQAKVNMGPVLPPQRKGKVPQYSRNKLEELQLKFDELEAMGVFVKPEEAPVISSKLRNTFRLSHAMRAVSGLE